MTTLKKSYYAIVSDPLNDKEDRIIFSTITSQAYIVEKAVYEAYEADEFESIGSEIVNKLEEYKILVPSDKDELAAIIQENKDEIAKDKLMYEVIQPTAMCQLGCDYCGQDHKKVNISKDLYAKLLERFRAKASVREFKRLYVGWFGGEPLMAFQQIRELTPMLKDFCKEFGMSYGAKVVTNGLSLKENIFRELVEDLSVDAIEVTLDGVAEYHDKRRHTKEKHETFDIIFNNLLNIVNSEYYDPKKLRLTIRCNVDERNAEGVLPLIELIDQHQLQKKIAFFYPIGVYSWGGNDAHKKSLTKEEFAEMEIDWYIEMIKRDFTVNLLPGRVKKVCLAVSPSSEMVDAYGNIFNCTEVSYVDTYKDTPYSLGNLKFSPSNSITETTRPLTNWNDLVLENKFPCNSCKMLPVCGGACPKSWHEDMRACPPNKFNIKEKLALTYLVSQKKLVDIENLDSAVLA